MTEIPKRLSPFARRVRFVRSWRGLAMGACLGAAAAAVWAALDWFGVAYTEWSWMAATVGIAAALGALAGFLLRVPTDALTKSIDRRAELDDRLTTASERSTEHTAFDDALRADADHSLNGIKAKKLYPIQVGRWQGGSVALCAVAAAIFLLGNTPVLLTETAKRTREELKKEGQRVERITRETLDTPEAKARMSEEEKRLADELRKFQRDLEKARMTKEEAMQKANEISKQADKLVREEAMKSETSLDNAQKALEKMQEDALKQAGMENVDPQMARMTDTERAQAEQQAQQQAKQSQQQMSELQSKLDALNEKLKNPNLSDAERKALEAQKNDLEKKMADAKAANLKAQKAIEGLKLSKEAQAVLKKMMENPLFKQLQEMAQKLRQNAKSTQQKGQPELTKEQRLKLQKKMEELLKKLKDDKAMQEYLKQMLEAMKRAGGACDGSSLCMGLGVGASASPIPAPGQGGPQHGGAFSGMNKVAHTKDAWKEKGKGSPTMVTGNRRPMGEETYIEIKAPTTVGNRSAIPYVKVLPSYKKKAESALNRQEIPKEHEKRVKAYFESLSGK